MIGIDLIEIDRVQKTANQAFLDRIFVESEKQYIKSKSFAPQTIAGLFAAKEAVLKALGCGIANGTSFSQIEIFHSPSGQPQVALSGKCLQLLNTLGSSIFLSISHNDTTAVAVATILS